MKASKKSIHAKLYHFTYNSELPHNLCPYFWKLLWAIVILIPNLIIQLPSRIENLFEREDRCAGGHRECGFMIYLMILIICLYGICTFHWIKAIFDCYSYDWKAANSGWIFNLAIAIGLIVYLIKNYKSKNQKTTKEKEEEKKPSIIIEFVKAKYNRYCPKIEWEENITKEKQIVEEGKDKNGKISAIVGQGESEPPMPIPAPFYPPVSVQMPPDIPESEKLSLKKEQEEKRFILLGLNGYNSPILEGIFDTREEAENFIYSLKGFNPMCEYIYWKIEEWNRNPNPHYIPKS